MDLKLSDEQVMLRDMVTRYLADAYNFASRERRIREHGGFDLSVWRALAENIGILGAALPEEAGGFGGGAAETMVIMEALGEALAVEPFLETVVIGAGLLQAVSGDRAAALLGGVTAGEVRLALAANEIGGAFELSDVSTTARRNDNGWILEGAKPVVVHAPSATSLVVTARTSGEQSDAEGISLFLVDPADPAIEWHRYRLIDDRPAADLFFAGVQLDDNALIGPEGGILPILEKVMDAATAAVCSEAVGGMRRMLDATVEYTKQRRQFGQPLANFQVLQHRMVDMYMMLEQSISAVLLATLNLDAAPTQRQRAVSAAKVTINRSARMIGQNAVQLHGGMGMTDELAVGHYFKRATVIEHSFGSTDEHLRRYRASY